MEQIAAMIEQAHKGDKAARENLISQNIGLVWSIVKRFENRGHDREELFQIGSMGLMKAIDKFDTSFEVRFSTYAVPVISGEIKRFLRDDGLIKVSRSLKENGYKLYQSAARLAGKLGREATLEEICKDAGLSMEEAVLAMDARIEVESIYKSVYQKDGSEIFLVDQVMAGRNSVGCVQGSCAEAGAETTPEETIVNHMLIEQLMSELEENERKLLEMRYFQEKTQAVVAKELGMSQVQVSRLEKKLLLRMRSRLTI